MSHPMSDSSAAPVYSLRDLKVLPDITEIPTIGSQQRDLDERAVMARAREFVIELNGSLRDALDELEIELRGLGGERPSAKTHDLVRQYARKLVDHVEQCWATAVLR